ncbi:MAG: hypothetical protein GY830_02975, partial [Bacteroidetes bacterium]|nr:hypothetical protein [Bacteroidota bacterium]
PPEWAKEYKGSHAVQVRDKPTNYSVLVGSDLHIHPLPCLTPEGGQLLDSSGALALFRSQITHRYLCVGQAKDRYFPGQDDTDKDFVAQHSALHAARLEVVSEELADVQSPPWGSRPSIEEVLSDEEEPTPGLSLGRVRFGRDYDTDIEEDSLVTSTLDEDLRQPCNHGPSDDAATALTSQLHAMRAAWDPDLWDKEPKPANCSGAQEVSCLNILATALGTASRAEGREVWRLGKEINEDDPNNGESVEEQRYLMEQKVEFMRTEINDLHNIASNCRGCCPRIKELSSQKLSFERMLKKSLELLDDTEPAGPNDDAAPSIKLTIKMLLESPAAGREFRYWQVKKGRKKHKIQLNRILRMPAEEQHSFRGEARRATERIIAGLKNRPQSACELAWKLANEHEQGVTYTVEEYLQRPEVIAAGINSHNVGQYSQFVGLLCVYNPKSANTPVRLVFNPSQKKRGTNETINSNIAAPKSYVADLRPTYFRMALTPQWGTGDLEGFYLRTRLDPAGCLANCFWVQGTDEGVPTLTGDPRRKLLACVKVSPCFGAVDSGSHAQLALMSTPELYKQHKEDDEDKIPDWLVDLITDDLKKAFVDDVAFTASLKEIKEAMKDIQLPEDPEERIRVWREEGKKLLELKIYVTTHVVDQFGYSFKGVSIPSDKALEDRINTNPLLLCSQPKAPRDVARPLAAN